MSKSTGASGGVGLPGLLVLLFIALKLTGHVDWAWLWVLAPLWIPLAFGFAVVLPLFVVIALVSGRK